jgi:NADPH:quinone reductase-like Zn-dependent oxidoreductase
MERICDFLNKDQLMPTTSTGYRFTLQGDTYGLVQGELQIADPGPHEVLIKVHAASLNYRDLIHWRNKAGRPMEGVIPCSDGAGEVVAVGSKVTRIVPGSLVAGSFFQEWVNGPFEMKYHQQALGGSANGMLAQHVLLNEQGVVKIPAYLNGIEASTLPCAAVTAWAGLVERGGLHTGQTVLVLGTGGVSIFALQLAKAHGAKVIVTSSHDDKLVHAKELGADETVNYKTHPDWDKVVWELTHKQGVDHVVEVGGPGTLAKSLGSVKASGSVALIGVLTGFGPMGDSLFPLVAKNASIHGIYVGSREYFERMARFMEQHQMHPIIDKVFDFDHAQKAFEYQESGQHFGKVVIKM